MKLNQIDIEKNTDGKICISQKKGFISKDSKRLSIFITPEMVDSICNELQRLKTQIVSEKHGENNG